MPPAASLAGALAAPGDLIQLGMLGVVLAGQVVTWRAMRRDDRRHALRRGAEAARADADQAAAIKEGAAANQRLAKALESLERWARDHEVADAKFHATLTETQRQTSDTLSRCVDMQMSLQAQLTGLAMRGHGTRGRRPGAAASA